MNDTMFGALVGIFGVLIGVWLTYRFSKNLIKESHKNAIELIKKQSFINAASDFRAAFIEVQRLLDRSKTFDITVPDGTRVIDILNVHIIAHEKAMLVFRPYISESELASFDEAWKTYYSQKNEYDECLTDYESIQVTSSVDDPKHENNLRKLALSRIENLLSFASYK